MGWSYGWATQAKLIASLMKESTWQKEDGTWVHDTIVAHKLVGDCLWSVAERQYFDGRPAERWINLDLIDKCGSEWGGRNAGEWGYKDMSEIMHPYYYSCPLAYLGMAPEQCAEWRAKVREVAAGLTPWGKRNAASK